MKNYEPIKSCQIPDLKKKYKNYFGYKTDGVFVELGAFDGETYSNTSCLADIGWTGLYVEPVTDSYNKCVSRHGRNPNVKVINKAMSSKDDEKLKIYTRGAISSIHQQSIKNYERCGWWGKPFNEKNPHEFINSITLESLLKEEDIAPNFDLLGVDVEGYEYEVFKDFDLNKWSPKMVIIELHDKNPRYASLNEEGHLSYVRDLFLDNGYSILFENPSNTIFVI